METKNTCVKKILFSLFVILLPMLASAEKVEIGDIWYDLISETKEAKVVRDRLYTPSSPPSPSSPR